MNITRIGKIVVGYDNKLRKFFHDRNYRIPKLLIGKVIITGIKNANYNQKSLKTPSQNQFIFQL